MFINGIISTIIIINIITLRSTFYCATVMYFCHYLFKLNRTFILSGFSEHLCLSVCSFPVAQMVEHGASNAKIMGSIPRESKSWSNVKL